MRKNIRKIIALFMTITMILAVCPVEIFAAGEDAAVSSVVAEQTEGDSAVAEASDSEPVLESGKTDSDEAEEPVSNNQSEEVSEQSGAEFVLEKNDTVLPAPTLQRFNRSNVAKRYVITAVFEGEGTEQSPYLIQSADDWDTLANHINSGGTDYNGKYFKLTDDITVTTVLGIRPGSSDSADRPFVGTFNGAGHTLTVNYNKSGFVAPFAIAHNSTIENLKVKGTVRSTDNHASGLVGASKDVRLGDASYLNIKNVTISTDISCNSHVAGVIGHAHSATITMENVVFDGSLNASSVQGGFIGWGGANQGRLFNCTLKDCMFAGTYKSGVAFNPVAYASGQGNVVLTNDFYTTKSASGGSPITPTGSGTVKLVAATVEKDDQVNYFDNIATAASSENWVAGSTLKLMSDVTTASTITVPTGSHTLDLNGHTLKAGSAGYSVITVGSGAALVIDDTASGGKITGGSVGQNYGGGITVDGGKLTLKGGAISGNANTYSGIGNCGGGIHVKNSGEFYMEGGEISGNTSYVGGGVCSDGSATTVSITGGVIKNNTTERFASAIWAGRTDNATFLIGGTAEIVDNISTWTSDKNGEASVNFSKLSISGNPTVRGCWKTTGNSAPNAHINLDNNGSSVQRIALDGALTNESGTPNLLLSPIYRWNDLQSGKTFVFTENWSTYMGTAHPADYFGVDASVSGVRIIRKDGEAAFTGSSDLGDLYITYNANGGTGEMDAQLVSTTSAVLNQNLFTNGNKEFIGWNTKADGSGTPYSDKGDITLSGDVTLYAQWAEKHAHDDIDFKIWTSTTFLPTKAGDYYLGADVTISSTWNVPSGTVNLCLDGHGIKMVGSGSVINVGSSAVLNVYDCGETEHKFTVNSPASNGAGLATVDDTLTSGYKTFTGGYITGGNAREGGGIKVNGTANLTLNGGTIIGNQSSFMGAGIKADNNGDNTNINITVNGGAIIYNTVNGYGAGICSDGAVRVNGGTIAYNYATKDPGGIHCHYLYLSGGSIVNNYADDNEYSAGVHADHEVFISGNPVISDNVYKGTPYNLDWDRTELAHGHKLNITGALSEGAQISVTLKVGGTGVFTNGWKANMGEADPAKYFTSDNADYTVILKDGEAALEYPPVPDVSASGYTGDYDGAAHSIAVSVPTGATVQYGTKEGAYSLTENPSYINAGTYNVYYKVTMDKHTPVEGSAVVTINQIDVTVTITGHNTTVNYDGKAHSADGYDFAADTTLYTAADFTFSGRAEAVRTDAGKTEMGLSAEQFSNTNENFASVTFNVTDGFVKIDPIDVTVTITGHNSTADYDGNAHSADGYDVAFANPLYTEADFVFNGRAEVARKDVGTTYMGLNAEQFENTSGNFATVTFNVTDGCITINKVDAVIQTAPHAKSTLDYNGKSQSLCVAGVAYGGTLYYALGKDMSTIPADKQFKTTIPTAKEIGNYYIWYKVKGDKNHNSLSPEVFKVTLADPDWVTISGTIFKNNKTPLSGAEVILMSGNQEVDTIVSYENGEYFFTVPAGVYSIVVKCNGVTVTNIADVSGDVTSNIVMPAANTDSVLKVVDSDKSIAVGGLEAEANAIRERENIPANVNVTVSMTVKAIAENETAGAKAITNFAKDKYVEFYDLRVERTVGKVTTNMDTTTNVLEIVIPCSFTTKRELEVFTCNGSNITTLILSDSKEPGTYRVDEKNGLIYIYANTFATVALAYQPYFSVLSNMTLGSFAGEVSVKLVKDSTGQVFELNHVSLQNISFTGVPKGTYTMTVTWTDGAENTLTLPFTIG